MLKFLYPVWRIAAVASVVIVLRVAVEVLAVYFLSPAVTTLAGAATTGGADGFVAWITGPSPGAVEMRTVLIWMATAQAALGLMIYLRTVWDTKLSMHVVYHMRSAVYDRLQRVNLSFYDKMSTGQLINRAIGDLQAVRTFVNMSLCSSLDIVVSIALYFGLLAWRSPWLMIAALVPVPVWAYVIYRFGAKARPLCDAQQSAADRLMGAMSENLAGVHVVRAFGTEGAEIAKYRRLNLGLLDRFYAMISLQARLTPTLKLIGSLSHIALFVLCARLIQTGRMSVGDIMLLGAAMSVILSKLQQINAVVEAYQKAIVSARRLFGILDLRPAVDPETAPEKRKLKFAKGEIEFRDVGFGYGLGAGATLKDISAVIPGGKVTALVGPTGSGKSTLAGLIARFYDPQAGSISVDGQDLRDLDLRDLRQYVGLVFQETFLFSSSVRDNIRYGRQDVSEEMLRRAARIADADGFIEQLPNGYDTLLGERGVMLSGGQRQRLALARALVYDPPILILDDATAALDATTEQTVYARLGQVIKGRTVLVIAHRLASVDGADHVLVMEKGRIVEAGAPEELIARAGRYRDFIRLQMAAEVERVPQGSAS